MSSKFQTYAVFFVMTTAAVVTGMWVYSMVNKPKIAPPPVAPL